MAAIAVTTMGGSGARTVTQTTLGSSDTFTYQAGDILLLTNASGSAKTPNLDGAGSSSVPVPGIGNIDVSSGLTLASIANGAVVAIPLDTIKAYLQGVTTISGASGMTAAILRN